MKMLVVYVMLCALCINMFGASIGQFIHQLSHLFDFNKEHLEMIESPNTGAHFHYSPKTQHISHSIDINNDHKHGQMLDFILATFGIQNGNTALPNCNFISLFMLIIDGIINVIGINLQSNLTEQELNDKPVVRAFLYKNIFLQTPSPPPKGVEEV